MTAVGSECEGREWEDLLKTKATQCSSGLGGKGREGRGYATEGSLDGPLNTHRGQK